MPGIITKIPVKRSLMEAENKTGFLRKKVAAYARVSTDFEDQISSYETQVRHYECYIKSRPDWVFAGIYTDEGITGTNMSHREGFKQMVADALSGRINLIVTKSVSRFARNTVDSLSTIRMLKEHDVEVYFEKENIWTFDGKGEVLLTIMSSLAQEEARSTSENCKWGIRKRFSEGKFTLPYSRFFGYDRGPDGNPVINEEQAAIVRRIFDMFLDGYSIGRIARTLTAEGVPTSTGKKRWLVGVIKGILTNEKHKGDALLQKSYIGDFLTKKQIQNDGKVQQYYIKGNHKPIVSEEEFDTVQSMLAYRAKHKTAANTNHPFSCLVYCNCCGGLYGPKIWHSNDKYRKIVWQCNEKTRGRECKSNVTTDEKLRAAFMKALQSILKDREHVVEDLERRIDQDYVITFIDGKLEKLESEVDSLALEMDGIIDGNARNVDDQRKNTARASKIENSYNKLQNQISALRETRAEMMVEKQKLKVYVKTLKALRLDDEFKESTLRSLVSRIETDGKNITFLFKDRMKFETTIEN